MSPGFAWLSPRWLSLFFLFLDALPGLVFLVLHALQNLLRALGHVGLRLLLLLLLLLLGLLLLLLFLLLLLLLLLFLLVLVLILILLLELGQAQVVACIVVVGVDSQRSLVVGYGTGVVAVSGR